jgi:calcineurin-like phosphoesterase family protein
MHPKEREFQKIHTEYCQKAFAFMIVGHVHNNWKTRLIAGVWHVNVGVDVNRYMPISDQEVLQIFEQAKASAKS